MPLFKYPKHVIYTHEYSNFLIFSMITQLIYYEIQSNNNNDHSPSRAFALLCLLFLLVDCPEGWEPWGRPTAQCVKSFNDAAQSYAEAAEYCQAQGGSKANVMEIRDEETNEFVASGHTVGRILSFFYSAKVTKDNYLTQIYIPSDVSHRIITPCSLL